MTSNVASPARPGGKGLTVAIAVCAALALVGVGFWMMQLSGGLIQTGMRNLDNWGLYIISFMWFVGLSAGGLIISSVPRVFGIKGFGGISKIAIMTSLACTCCAVAMILVDLGNPLRVWELIAYSNLSSPLMWDVLVITTYFVLSIVYLALTLRNEKGKTSDAALRVVSAICQVVAVLVHTVTAWIIGLQTSHELWNTALMGPWFVCSALVSGTALVIFACVILRKVGYLKLEQAHLNNMCKMLGAFCLVDLYFFGCDLLTEAFPAGSGAAVVDMLVAGPLAPFFWAQIILCAVCAVICFVPQLRRDGFMIAAAVMAMAGIFCKRVQLIAGGFQIPNISDAFSLTSHAVPNFEGTLSQAFSGMVYAPTALELIVFAGVLALGVMIFLLGVKLLDLKPNEKSH